MADTENNDEASYESVSIVSEAMKLYDDYKARENQNIIEAYDDLEFRAGNHWPSDVYNERVNEGRPVQTVNQMPQYVRQVTGDMRQMRPAIKVVPVDDNGDEEKAETLEGVIRYIEARSDAPGVYFQGADSQVACGIGAWRVTTEYASETTFNQEIRIAPIEDAIAIAFDPDAKLPSREDSKKCLVLCDYSRDKFKAEFPAATVTEFDTTGQGTSNGVGDWATNDTIRIGEYWYKKPVKKKLALMPDASIIDLSDATADDLALATASGARVETREGYEVYRAIVTAKEIVKGPDKWPGAYIPIVPVIGEEIRIGRRIVRHGVIRFAKDPQRSLNYNVSAETEAVALQPKAPFIGTETNFEQYQDIWENANRKNFPYLPYTPDQKNGNLPPQRAQPATSSQGFTDGIARAERHIQTVIGIYNASLGAASNETSGKAITARQREGDTGTFVYIDNWSRAIRHTGKILVDLIPHVYDTPRVLRIIGEDGKMIEHSINQRPGSLDGAGNPIVLNDVTVGSYDVAITMGPSYSTKREEAKDGMNEMIRSVPDVFPLIGDLFAKAQDWPMADKISERLSLNLPPAVKEMEAKDGKQIPQLPPDPAQVMQAQEAQAKHQLEMAKLQIEAQKLEVEREKLKVDAAKIEADVHTANVQAHATLNAPQQPAQDPRVDQIAQAVQELQGALQRIIPVVQEIAQAMAPPDIGISQQSTQPPQGGFFHGA